MVLFQTFVIFVAMVAASFGGSSPDSDQLPTIEVRVEQDGRSEAVTTEVAITPAQRSRGLMFRYWLPEDAGMLFVFDRNSSNGFYMCNTYVPLDIVYIQANGDVRSIRQGEPLSTEQLPPDGNYRYVLELNRGWMERHGFDEDARVIIPEDLPEPSDYEPSPVGCRVPDAE